MYTCTYAPFFWLRFSTSFTSPNAVRKTNKNNVCIRRGQHGLKACRGQTTNSSKSTYPHQIQGRVYPPLTPPMQKYSHQSRDARGGAWGSWGVNEKALGSPGGSPNPTNPTPTIIPLTYALRPPPGPTVSDESSL